VTLTRPCPYDTGLLIPLRIPLPNGFKYQCIRCGGLFQGERVEYEGVKPGVVER
jgi:hypothetical protein